MDDRLKQDFTRRLSQCNSGGMIVIIYDILFAYMDDVKKAYEDGEHEEMKNALRKSQRVLDEMIQSLDFSYELSNNLYALYVFCKNELARTLYQNQLDGLNEADKILRRLYGSFVEAARQDTSGPMMRNTQQVYAGMTYGRGELNESYMDNDNQRGFFV
ncbi:MAG: flagellar protein FliS [Lachnospiraceae bacterium]|nr:flagellar protein FliS [Agathobacter sp.]MDD6290575.1 flagellar protein FliS [Lachnospiraceae bacterium]